MSTTRGAYLRPVVLAELDDRAGAAAELDRQLDLRRERTDAEAEQFRRFAQRFEAWAAERPRRMTSRDIAAR